MKKTPHIEEFIGYLKIAKNIKIKKLYSNISDIESLYFSIIFFIMTTIVQKTT